MDLKRMLKVYNYVNDERRPKVNLKFIGLLLGFLVVGGLLISFSMLNPTLTERAKESAPASMSASEGTANGDGSFTQFVGMTPVEAAVYGTDADLIQARLAGWVSQNPDADVQKVERHYDAEGRWVGYDVTYTPA